METAEYNGLIALLSRFLGTDEQQFFITDNAARILATRVLTVLRDMPASGRPMVIQYLNENANAARHQMMREMRTGNSFADAGEQRVPILDERAIETLLGCINFPEMASPSL